ncbi:response regulator transcription factor [Tessaracoccus lubricantis]|uniref:Response regulator transcription factor n=1 Tax=Tessaracoccus lubricantis TaxID=545543 RepID=A0ABP9F1T3_9ACTN
MTHHPPIRVVALDDHDFILRSLGELSQLAHGELEMVGSFTDPDRLLAEVDGLRPSVAVVDLFLNGRICGHETIEALAAKGIWSIAFTAEHRRVPVMLAMQAGARGLVLKSDPVAALVQAIRDVADGGWSQSSVMAATLLQEAESVPSLSPQELHCLRLAGEGVPVKAIGRQFDPPISLSSVKTYLARAYEKYAAVGREVVNTTHAALETAGDGWFDV